MAGELRLGRVPRASQPGRAHAAVELRRFLRRLRALGLMILALVVLGTAGFMVTEDVGVWDGFVWSLDTIATLGSIPAPQDTGAEVVKVVLIVLGVGTLFYGLVTVTEVFVSGHLGELLDDRRTQKLIDAATDHYIVCGFGRVGRQVVRDLQAAGATVVVVDHDPGNHELARQFAVRFVEGEPSEDAVLRAAGIERARAVMACVDSDADNVFITLTVRELRPDIAIVARAAVEETESKLLRAGASRVISPYKASGTEMARLALNPQVSGVLDVTPEYRLEEIRVAAGCRGAGMTIGDVRGGAIIVGVRDADGAFQPQPPAETILTAGDVVMAMGTARTLDRLESLFDVVRDGAGTR
jgi:voltage-gated potassium channel